MVVIVFAAVYLLSAIILPFPNWTSYHIAFSAVLTAPGIPIKKRISMLAYLAKEILILPVWAMFWLCDEVVFARYHNAKIRAPIFIVSQPRSGTTFLLRTLSEDGNTFLSIKHLEWRYPYISFWKLVDCLHLRHWLESRSYWPNTKIGRKCRKIHYHVLGSFEEFGIFLEERFFHHYFVFRRFPFPDVLNRVSSFDELPHAQQQAMLATFLNVVKKVYHYRGDDEIFLAKENECVEFCRALIEMIPDARLLFIVREPGAVLQSYRTMSVTCTEVKHGIDPQALSGWHDINVAFRREQCRKFVDYFSEVRRKRRTVLISFADFTTEVLETTLGIYQQLGLPVSDAFRQKLEVLQRDQRTRDRGYVNLPREDDGFEFYAEFVRMADQRTATREQAVS